MKKAMLLENTNGKIRGIRSGINNDMKLFLTDGGTVSIPLETTTEEDFIRIVKEIDGGVEEDFLRKLYNHFKNVG